MEDEKIDEVDSKEARWGEKMIEVKIRFWTNDLADGDGKILPKHAWSSGVVRMERNDTHGIEPLKPRTFNSLLDLPAKIEEALLDHGIKLHPSRRMKRYLGK